MPRPLLLLLLLPLATAACQSVQVTTAPVDQVGTPVVTAGDTEAPDAIAKALALAGANTAVLLGPAVKQLSELSQAYYDARAQYTRYRVLSGPAGWEFRRGWYWRTDNAEGRTLRAQFQDTTGMAQTFDLTFDVNYGPDMHPGFPSDMTVMRAELDMAMPSGGQVSATFLGGMAESRTDRLTLSGTGAISAGPPMGAVAIEALSAAFVPGGDAQSGPLVLKSLAANSTYQFSGQYNALGVEGIAKLYRNLALIGEVANLEGQWQLRNKSGSYPLQ